MKASESAAATITEQLKRSEDRVQELSAQCQIATPSRPTLLVQNQHERQGYGSWRTGTATKRIQ